MQLQKEQMAAQAPPGLIGMHTNMAAVVPPEIDKLPASAVRHRGFTGRPGGAPITLSHPNLRGRGHMRFLAALSPPVKP